MLWGLAPLSVWPGTLCAVCREVGMEMKRPIGWVLFFSVGLSKLVHRPSLLHSSTHKMFATHLKGE